MQRRGGEEGVFRGQGSECDRAEGKPGLGCPTVRVAVTRGGSRAHGGVAPRTCAFRTTTAQAERTEGEGTS